MGSSQAPSPDKTEDHTLTAEDIERLQAAFGTAIDIFNRLKVSLDDFGNACAHVSGLINKLQGRFSDKVVEESKAKKEKCMICGATESKTWWKCCPEHTTEQGPEVICESCKTDLHPNGV